MPAGEERVSFAFVTPSTCTQSLWTEPINILGVVHHLHTYGTYQETNIVRDGVNLGNLRPELKYDFMHQGMGEPIPALRQLLPGDQITQTCFWNTTNAQSDVGLVRTRSKKCASLQCITTLQMRTRHHLL